MLKRFLSRPLTMNVYLNAVIYGTVTYVLNSTVIKLFVSKENPEGLTGFWGTLWFFFCIALSVRMSRMENQWVEEIREANKSG